MSPHLVVENLAKSYGGVQAVRHVSFSLERGEVVAMIGPNGAGKSTCFNMLNGQIVPDAGRIRIGGQDTTGLRPSRVWRHGVGRTFQITATFASMTVRENVQVALLSHRRLVRRLVGAAERAQVEEADALLDLVGMGDAAGRPGAELAYGDLKRLELAVALANRPTLLFMDEPTAGMGTVERGDLMRLAVRIARERAMAVLFTEHDTDVVFGHADRVLVLARGEILAEGPPDEIRRDPRVREVYLGAGSAPTGLEPDGAGP